MKRLLLSAIVIILCSMTSLCQRYSPYIKFENSTVSFDTIREEQGSAVINFKYTNTGAEPLIIKKINSSTRRIKTEWDSKPLLPKKTGILKISYDPHKMKGKFSRTITVITNAKNNVSILKIEGFVIPRPLTLEEKYPVVMDELRFRKNENRVYFNDIKNTEKRADTIHFINYSENPVSIAVKNVPKHIEVAIQPEKIKAKEKGEIIVSFDAQKIKEYGYTYKRIPIIINEKENYRNSITVNAVIVEDFSELSEKELEKAPRIEFEKTRFEFGTIQEGEKVSHRFKFKNTGKNNLLIRKVKAGCGCTALGTIKKVISPGEESYLEVTFDSKHRSGRQHKFITFICNDPKNHTIRLEVVGNIRKQATK